MEPRERERSSGFWFLSRGHGTSWRRQVPEKRNSCQEDFSLDYQVGIRDLFDERPDNGFSAMRLVWECVPFSSLRCGGRSTMYGGWRDEDSSPNLEDHDGSSINNDGLEGRLVKPGEH